MAIEKSLAEAIALYDAGRPADAEPLFREILQSQPTHPVAMHLLGVICAKTGRPVEGVGLVSRSVALRPRDPDFRRNLAASLRIAGRSAEACENYRAAFSLKPDAGVMVDLANVLVELGRYSEAEQCAREAIKMAPRSLHAHIALGSALLSANRLDEALSSFQQAVNLDSRSGEAYKRLGIALYHRGRFPKAQEILELADRLAPGDPELMNQIGFACEKNQKYADAVGWFNKVLVMDLKGAEGLAFRANALESLDRLDEAISLYKEALAINPDMWTGGLASALGKLGRTDEAMAYYKRMLERHPDYPLAHLNYGLSLLQKGRYEEGWPEYDWRWGCPTQHEGPRDFPQPVWRKQDGAGKRVLLYAEQGLGDTLLTVRYVPLVQQRGAAKVSLECQGALASLFQRSLPGVEVIRSNDPLPGFDIHASLFDLPLVFGTTLETVPATVPYLVADPEKVAFWQNHLGSHGFKVGLVWAGGATNPGDRVRSMRLSDMAPLASVPADHARFISLQKGPPSEELAQPPAGLTIEDPTKLITNFDDTAAMIQCLDLVISVDTSVAHLAGALGKPVWIAFPYSWFWLYLENRSDSPWYPTVRLFRQRSRGDWSGPMTDIAVELKRLAGSAKPG